MTRSRLPAARLLAAAALALLCLLIPLDAGAQNDVPGAPTVDPLISGETWLGVTWTAPSSNGGSSITAYDLRHIETSADETVDANWTVVEDVWETGSGDLAYVLSGLDNGTEYDVQVRAANADGEDGTWSDTQGGTPGDYGGTQTDATELILNTSRDGSVRPVGSNRFPGEIDPAGDIDYFQIELSDTHVPTDLGVWIFTSSDIDTVGELLDENGVLIERDDYGAVLPNVEDFFIWTSLEAGTYYLKVTGYGSGDTGDYQLVIRTFADTECAPNKLAVVLALGGSARGMLDTDEDTDCFVITLTDRTDVILRSSGFPDAVGELLDSRGNRIASNDDGLLVPSIRQFLIRNDLQAGTYFLRVRSFAARSDGPFVVYATEAGDPGNTAAAAEEIELGVAAGGNIASGTDVDYFKITLAAATYVRIWTARNSGNVDTDGELLDSSSVAVADLDFAGDFSGPVGFGIEHHLDAGMYYIKVTGDNGTGQYTIRVSEDVLYQRFVDSCLTIGGPSGVSDQYSGCQWHLDNRNQLRGTADEDINVTGVWSAGNLGEGINVAVVDDGMHHQHEDLHENVETSRNHDYRPGSNEIHTPGRTHGTAVAGLIAARDNSIGMRGVAPRATIYGYNYLVGQSNANEANAMSRNAATTAISNNSWGPGDFAGPEPATTMWEEAVEKGVTDGYDGKGVLYVWSGGNGAEDGDNSNLDEYNNLYAVTSVCAVNHDGKRSSYSEPGANLWVCAPSSDRENKAAGIATTDNGNRYQDTFGGTSASAPIVSGVAALIRSANNDLTWRDVKLILAASARKNDSANTGWEEGEEKYGDTGNYNFNHQYGFGVVDAAEAVDLASGWRNLPPLRKSSAESRNTNLSIPDATEADPANMVTGGPGNTVTSVLTLDSHVEFIEYIHVDTNFSHTSFRDLDIELESPSGKVSKLVPFFEITATNPFVPLIGWSGSFRFGSAKHLGENSAGEWTLKITDHHAEDMGRLRSWKITAFGHGTTPLAPGIDEVFPASGGFTVTWKAPDDTGQSDISRYDVRHILSSATDADKADDTKWTEENAGNPGTLQYTASGLTADVQYDVQVRAVTSEGDGLWSETETVTPLTDEAPTIETITPGNGTLTAAWTAPTNTALGTVTSYDLRYGRGSAPSSWTTVDDAWTSGTLEYVVEPYPLLTNGVTYGVQVRAVVGTDDKAWSSTRTGTPRTVPGAPTIAFVDPDEDGELLVEWRAPSDDGGAGVTSYDVRYIRSDAIDKADPTNWTERIGVVDGTPGDEKYVATGLMNWVKYDVQARAVNPAGAGDWSATQTGTPTNSEVGVTLRWDDTSVDVGEDGSTVTLTATATTDRDEALPSDFFFDATVTTTDGSATDPDDYSPPITTALTFDNDFTRTEVDGRQRYRAARDFAVTILNDTVDESDETFTATLVLVNPDIDNLELKDSTATVTIKDDEHVPVMLGWLDDPVSVNEGSAAVTLNATATTTVNKRPESGFSFQATVSTSRGTAAAGEDYTHRSTTVTFQQSDSWSAVGSGDDRRYRATQSITVPIINDTEDERDESFTATVSYVDSNPPHLQGGLATATVTIVDDDLPKVSIRTGTTTAEEDQALEFTLTRVGILTDPLTVNVRVSETGRMLASGQPTMAMFSPLSSTATLNVALDDDTTDEDNSVVTVAVRSGSGYVPGVPSSAAATAMDNDHVPVTLSWDRTAVTVSERTRTVTLRAVVSTTEDKQPESGFSFGVNVTYTDGTADSSDYSAATTSATFQRSDFSRSQGRYRATKDFTVTITSGDGDEADENFTATLAYTADPLPPHLQGGSPTATVTITDDDDPLVTITADDSSVAETEDSITFTLTHDGGAVSSLRANVDVSETGGNVLARSGRYTVNFAAGSNDASLEVNLRDDTEDEDDSTVAAEVINGSGYFPGSPSSAETIVTDDDHVPVELEWEETELRLGEDIRSALLTAVVTTTKDKAPEIGFTVNASVTVTDGSATGPEDYSPSSSTTITFNQGDFRQETVDGESRYQADRAFNVTIVSDNEHEPDENFTARLAWETPGEPHLRGGNSTARVTIIDDDPVPLVLSWEQPAWAARESDGSITLKAVATTTTNRLPEEGFSFDASVSTSGGGAMPGTDFTGLSATETYLRSDFRRATFDGQQRYRAEKEFTITISDDGIDESNEDFSVFLDFASSTHANLATGITAATVWIIEDDTTTADVQISRNSSPGSVSQGATLTYQYTIKNNGPAEATGVALISVLDDNVRVNTPDLPSECSHSGGLPGGEINCILGTLDDDDTKEVSVEAIVESVPNDGIVNRAYVTSSVADPSPENNTYPSPGSRPAPPITPGGGTGGGPVNRVPVFLDSEGNAITGASREIPEGAAVGTKVGGPVVAIDPDEDTLTYTVSGGDAASFVIDASTGQLTTNAALDREAQASYSVTVTATDPSGATAEIEVAITVTVTEVEYDCTSGNAVADAAGNPGLVADCEALLKSRDRLAGDASLNWAEDTAITEWDGVRLGGTPQRVTRLYLVRQGLTGTMPADLGSLSALTGLYLHRNELTGPIPSQLGELSSLVHLTLHRNRLSGEVPAALGDLTALTFLSLYRNNLVGAIPAELGGLTSLRWLYLHSNKSGDGGGLSGPIPATFRNLGSLERLLLYGNSLSGAIPAELGRLPNLKSLLLHDNELTGQIPSELGSMSSLRYLWLDDNDLSGAIPPQLGNLSSLRWLSLYGNALSGAIPGELGDLSGLRLLILDRNDLSGAIPARLGELSELTWLDLNDNDLSGSIPSSLGDLSNLEHLYLHDNELTGAVPADLGRLSELTNLWLRDNRLSGRIPASLGELPDLQRVRIAGNAFTGCVPDGLLGGSSWYSDAEELGLPACGP